MRSRTVRQWTRHAALSALLAAVVVTPARAQTKAPSPAGATQYQIPAGTMVSLRLRTPIHSGSSRVGDQVDAVLTEPLTQEGVELVPSGSLLHGSVLKVEAASREVPLGQISIAFAVVQHGESGSRAPFRTWPINFEAERPAQSPGKPRKSKSELIDVSWPAGHLLSATLAEPLLVAIPKSTNAAATKARGRVSSAHPQL